nr:immunoglobulin light chain junction region [Macaca mulatta]
CMQNTHLPWTF